MGRKAFFTSNIHFNFICLLIFNLPFARCDGPLFPLSFLTKWTVHLFIFPFFSVMVAGSFSCPGTESLQSTKETVPLSKRDFIHACLYDIYRSSAHRWGTTSIPESTLRTTMPFS